MSVKIENLQNEIVFASDTINAIETVSVSVLVKAGSRNETSLNNGISHFLEHMAFKGTQKRTAQQIAEEFDMIGGYFNAYTSREKTVYYAQVLKEDVNVALDILSDILQNSLYEPEEIEREKGVIIQEIAQNNDSPDSLVFDLFYEKAFSDQPFGRCILGKEEFINSVTRDHFLEFTNKHYHYDNIVIGAAGNLDHKQMKELCDQYFTTFSQVSVNPLEKGRYKGGDIRINRELEQVHTVIGYEGVSYHDDEYYVLNALSIIFGGGMSSRLFQEIREKRGLAYSISSFMSSYHDTGIFAIYSGTSSDKINELIDVIATEIESIVRNIHDDELKRAKAQVRASLLMRQESSVYRAEKLAANLANFDRYIEVQETIDKINNIAKEDILNVARKIFSSKNVPTIASIGKISNLYSYENIVGKVTI